MHPESLRFTRLLCHSAAAARALAACSRNCATRRGYQQYHAAMRKGWAAVQATTPPPAPPPEVPDSMVCGFAAWMGSCMCCAHPRACLQNPLLQLYNSAGLLRCLQVAGALMPNLLPGILKTIQDGFVAQLAAGDLVLDSAAAAAWLQASTGSTNECVWGLATGGGA